MLKQLENLSDERVVLQFKRNPYYQYFCGYPNYIPDIPCNATELVHFRKSASVLKVLTLSLKSVSPCMVNKPKSLAY
ncbi:hypothetical protein BSPLISOX_3291 [uncultured Gammaproteobacteria bacterium]|nr:hypothetical protein BSPLISOX_3291 [uncultured Gammaproteobacteria bacterium]